MKKLVLFSIAAAALALCAFAEQTNVTTAAISIPAPTKYGPIWSCSVKNKGSATVYARCNVAVEQFEISTFIPIGPEDSYNFRVGGVGKSPARTIGNVVIATSNSTSTVNIGFE